jgi:hypothetical protein
MGAFLLSAFTPGNTASPVPVLVRGLSHASHSIRLTSAAGRIQAHGPARSAKHLAALGPRHPLVPRVAPISLQAAAASVAPEPLPGPHCDNSQSRGKHANYQGSSVSVLYDSVFRPSVTVPYLENYVPQALTTWDNWDNAGHTLVLLGMYRNDHKSYLVGFDPDSGRTVGTVMIAPSHLGGMGVLGDWLFAQDDAPRGPHNHHPKVRRYRIEALRAAMQNAIKTGDKVYLATDGPAQAIDAIDFFAVDGDSAYAGNHGDPGAGRMYRYQLTSDGHLQQAEGPWATPPRAQGMVLTPEDFIFSADEGADRGQLAVIRRDAPGHLADPIACMWIPSMPEDMTVHNGNLFLVFESGTTRYAKDHPVNRITHLHTGPLLSLLHLTDPVVLAPGLQVNLPNLPDVSKLPVAAPLAHDLASVPVLGDLGVLVAPTPSAVVTPPPAPDQASQHASDAYESYNTAARNASTPAVAPSSTPTSTPAATDTPAPTTDRF